MERGPQQLVAWEGNQRLDKIILEKGRQQKQDLLKSSEAVIIQNGDKEKRGATLTPSEKPDFTRDLINLSARSPGHRGERGNPVLGGFK